MPFRGAALGLLPIAARRCMNYAVKKETAMKMRQEVFDSLYSDIKEVLSAVRETGLQPMPRSSVNVEEPTIRDMWDIYQKTLIDRGNADHPMYANERTLPRVLAFTDQSPYFLYNDEDLDDANIETAFRAMQRKWAEDRIAKEAAASPAP